MFPVSCFSAIRQHAKRHWAHSRVQTTCSDIDIYEVYEILDYVTYTTQGTHSNLKQCF